VNVALYPYKLCGKNFEPLLKILALVITFKEQKQRIQNE